MAYRDIVDFQQESVKFIEDEKAIKLLKNELYQPILLILREGLKTVHEIEEEYKKYSKKTPNIKSLYRHIKTLTDAGLIVEAGVRSYTKSTATKNLYGRTAKFFYLSQWPDKWLESILDSRNIKAVANIIQLTHNKKPSIRSLTNLVKKLNSCQITGIEHIFRKFPNELVEIMGDLPIEDVERILEVYSSLNILLSRAEYEKEFEESLG